MGDMGEDGQAVDREKQDRDHKEVLYTVHCVGNYSSAIILCGIFNMEL